MQYFFPYVGATFAEIHHYIAPLLWTLLGGVGTTLDPLVGTGIMHCMIDFISGWTSTYLLRRFNFEVGQMNDP